MRNVAAVFVAGVLWMCLSTSLSGQTAIEPDVYTRWLLTTPAEKRFASRAISAILGFVLPAQPVFPGTAAYEGATRDRVPGKLLRFYVHCRKAPHCEGWFIIDRREMAMWVFVPNDALDFMLVAVKTAERLLDEWEDEGQKKD